MIVPGAPPRPNDEELPPNFAWILWRGDGGVHAPGLVRHELVHLVGVVPDWGVSVQSVSRPRLGGGTEVSLSTGAFVCWGVKPNPLDYQWATEKIKELATRILQSQQGARLPILQPRPNPT